MPFTVEQFFEVFKQYNEAVWPAQVIAVIFAAGFIVQAGLLIWFGVIRARLQLEPRADAAGVLGAMLVLYALVAYPVLGNALGHSYPAGPTFGLPCPTTISTFGLFLWARPRMPLSLVVIPVLWALLGTVAALQFGVGEDAGLAVSALVAVPLLARHGRALAPRPA